MEAESQLVDRWRSLLTSYNAVAAQLERALQEAHGLTLSDFEPGGAKLAAKGLSSVSMRRSGMSRSKLRTGAAVYKRRHLATFRR